MAQNTGGLGGLGGFFQRPAVQDTMDAIFTSMISSPRNNVLQNFAPAYNAAQDRRALMGEQAAMQEALVAAGLSPEQAKVMAVNPQAAKLRLDMMERQRDMEMQAQQQSQTTDYLRNYDPEIAEIVEAGGMSPSDGLREAWKRRQGGEMTDTQRNLMWRAEQAGLRPGTKEYADFMRAGGGSGGVTVNNMGNIPAGYEVQYDEAGRPVSMAPIAGSPAALEVNAANEKAVLRENQQSITSDTVLTAAKAARDAMSGAMLPATGTFSATVGDWLPESNAAEVNRQVKALKAVAASENINAMRQASPTGGALGNASDADIKLLQDKAGALDPGAGPSRFKKALDDYERTLLRIVHGPAAGDAIFQRTRMTPENYKDRYGLE
jgi:hypothetical protein